LPVERLWQKGIRSPIEDGAGSRAVLSFRSDEYGSMRKAGESSNGLDQHRRVSGGKAKIEQDQVGLMLAGLFDQPDSIRSEQSGISSV